MLKFMKLTTASVVVAGCLMVASGAPASAAPIDHGSFIRDADGTGLDWRDLTGTFNLSFNEVTAELGVGGDFEGYRFATVSEVSDFWTNAGIMTIGSGSGSSTIANFQPISDLQGQMGTNLTDGFGTRSWGIAEDLLFGDNLLSLEFLFVEAALTGQAVINTNPSWTHDLV